MKRFVLERLVDVSGVSGTGIIGEGVLSEIKNHPMPVAFFWSGDRPTIQIYPSMEILEAIHGHDGATRVVWLDGPFEFHCKICHGETDDTYCVEHDGICPQCLREN